MEHSIQIFFKNYLEQVEQLRDLNALRVEQRSARKWNIQNADENGADQD